ncbi:MAG TPA: hypothetical protein PK466_01405 [Thermotogota bacterium]|nr:hypothetical protein [Thermotogota bacterium]HPJ87866.1 hypothetical protein [Thermotogota bacterium]HPR94959.1 hypothetical protein [Thermotogota bacterium]
MKKIPIILSIFIIVIIVVITILFTRKTEFVTTTFKRLETYSVEEKVLFDRTIELKTPTDDFIETILVHEGDRVVRDALLLKFERDEEEFLLSKARNEYAMAVLNAGNAIQEEKKKAIELAEKRLLNTEMRSPVDGYVITLEAHSNIFSEKGSTLMTLLESDSRPYIVLDSTTEAFLDKAEYISLVVKPDDIKVLISREDMIKDEKGSLLIIPVELNRFDSRNFNFLFAVMEIKYYSDDLAWIPSDYLLNSSVHLNDGTMRQVDIIEKKDDLILVNGINSGEILTTER